MKNQKTYPLQHSPYSKSIHHSTLYSPSLLTGQALKIKNLTKSLYRTP